MDLSDYAGFFIFVMIIGVLLLVLVAHQMEKQVGIIFCASLVGLFAGLFLKDLFEFEDATTETMTTLLISTLLPGIIIDTNWLIKYLSELKERNLLRCRETIIAGYECRKQELYKEKEQLEERLKANDRLHNLLTLLNVCGVLSDNFYKNPRLRTEREGLNELLRQIDEIKNKIELIDASINEIKTSNDYYRFLKIRRGEIG